MTKKSKIDPKKRKNGDNFFKMSSIIIIKNIKLIDYFPVFWLNFMTLVVGTCLDFCKPLCLNECSFLHIKLCLHGLQEKNDFFMMLKN